MLEHFGIMFLLVIEFCSAIANPIRPLEGIMFRLSCMMFAACELCSASELEPSRGEVEEINWDEVYSRPLKFIL